MKTRLLVLFAVVAAMAVACGSGGGSEIEITDEPFSFVPTVGNSAAYLTIANNGDTDDVLLAASADGFGEVQLHDVITEDGTARMVEQTDGIPIPAGEQVTLQPGGLHVMLIDAQQDYAVGDEITITLTFEEAGEVEITSTFEEREGGEGDMDGMDMEGMDMEGSEMEDSEG